MPSVSERWRQRHGKKLTTLCRSCKSRTRPHAGRRAMEALGRQSRGWPANRGAARGHRRSWFALGAGTGTA
jgi:hypothetical protein